MAQDRMLRAELRTSEKVNEWPISVRFFWTQLWGYCDDHGRGRYDARLIKAGTFPLDDEVTAAQVGRWMEALEIAGVIFAYEVAGKAYFECRNWDEHQSIRHKKKTNIPDSSGIIPGSAKKSAEVRNSPAQVEGEVEGEREGEGESADGAPPLFCSKHPDGTSAPCRACGNARRAREDWDKQQKHRPTVAGIITPADCSKHPGRPARGCDRCAEDAVAS